MKSSWTQIHLACAAFAAVTALALHNARLPRVAWVFGVAHELRALAIRAEIRELGPDHPWAGTYYAYDASLSLAPGAGYASLRCPCAPCYPSDLGAVEPAGSTIRIKSFVARDPLKVPSVASLLIPVRWGRTRLLVRTENITDLCNDVNTALPLSGDYWVDVVGPRIMPNAPAFIPAAYSSCVLRDVLQARVTALADDGQRATIDAGKTSGVFAGMRLWLCEGAEPRRYPNAVVRQIDEHSAAIEVVEWYWPDKRRARVGSVVVSRLPCPTSVGAS